MYNSVSSGLQPDQLREGRLMVQDYCALTCHWVAEEYVSLGRVNNMSQSHGFVGFSVFDTNWSSGLNLHQQKIQNGNSGTKDDLISPFGFNGTCIIRRLRHLSAAKQ